MENEWIIEKNGFDISDVELHGSKYLIGNGFMGYRGTMEEYSAKELVAVNLAGLFDKNGDSWRESVNAPNPLLTRVYVDDKYLDMLSGNVSYHKQSLDIKTGFHFRETVFNVNGININIKSERFASMEHKNIIAMKYEICADQDISILLKTGIDSNIWDINGPHLQNETVSVSNNTICFKCETIQNQVPLVVYENIYSDINFSFSNDGIRVAELILKQGEKYEFKKICGIYWGDISESKANFENIFAYGYDKLKTGHISLWDSFWKNSDVIIEGDEEAQLALRYSIYHLNIIAPRHTNECGIPARGLSGQVYKGAAFWDTEMFMMPFYNFTNPIVAKNLVNYRIKTSEGAKRKAEEFGYKGAFYAWESQETGDDACTLFNVTDVFTGRPLRTYFKDKQIHVSADMVFALWSHCIVSGNFDILRDGGIEMIYQCILFYYTYSSYKPYKNSFELNDVVGPDEYHERVNNNAFTNYMVANAINIFILALEKVSTLYPSVYEDFMAHTEIDWIYEFKERIFVPQPNSQGIIEQFDGYMKLEDVNVEGVKAREIKENEYWGGHGIASNTRVIKQADVVMLLSVLNNKFSNKIKLANWEFYEPYTEHGSSLSACAYAIVAANIGNTEWAYKYFMKTATVDLDGNSKQYLGTLYIGGSHPAANGGSWNTAIFGFAGVSFNEDVLDISPNLPSEWKSMKFNLLWKGKLLEIEITHEKVKITSKDNLKDIKVTVNNENYSFDERR